MPICLSIQQTKVKGFEMSGFSLRTSSLVIVGASLLSACGGGGGEEDGPQAFGPTPQVPASVPAAQACDIPDFAAQMLAAINEARATARTCGGTSFAPARALAWNDQLAQAAAKHSSDMASRNFVSHTGSDGSSAADRAKAAGYRGAVGENLAGGQTSVGQMMNELLRSPAHCANLMDPAYRTAGAACVSNRSTTYKTHWTQMLGR